MPTPKKRYLDSTPAVTKQQLAKTNKHSKSGIPVTYFTQSDAMSLLADNPNRTAVLDEVTVRPYKKLPMQSELFQGITNQAANEKADEFANRTSLTPERFLGLMGANVPLAAGALGATVAAPALFDSTIAPLSDYITGSSIAGVPATTWLNTGIEAGFAGHGLNHTINEGINGYGDAATTAMELIPLGRLAKPVYEGFVRPGIRLFNSPLTGKWTKIGNREYRLSPNSLGANGSPLELRAITTRITTENAASMTPKQWTAAQDAAIARGDMAEAQRLRDLHFRIYQNGDMIDVNGNPIHVYHGSPEENIIEFYKPSDPRLPAPKGINFKATGEEGIYTSPRKGYAANYMADLGGRYRVPLTKEQKALLKAGKTREEIGLPSIPKGRIYDLYSNTKLVPENLNIDFNPFTLSTKEAKLIKSKGYTGFDIPGKKYPEHVVLEPNQLKLADAVTYDDNGVRIPLGERDNFKLNYIRYGLIPIIGGGVGYGLYNKKSNKNKNIR